MRLKQIVQEGGNVPFTVDGREIKGGRIHRDDIKPTLQYVSKLTGIDAGTLWDSSLGSVGKQETSGDIDIALDYEDADFDTLKTTLQNNFDQVNVNPGLRQINLLVPIQGNKSEGIEGANGYVQVDIFFGKKAWMQFAYTSPGDRSNYKGSWRTILLTCVVNARTQFADYDEQNELIAKVGEIFDLNKGIMTQFRMRPQKKSGKGYVKGMKAVGSDNPEWQERYGDVGAEIREIDSPKDAAEFLFGPGTEPEDLESFEDVVQKVRQLPEDEQKLIEHIFQIKTGYTFDEVPKK